ncbi:MAG: hypothetical protein C0601_00345 [Candidatus Muiribacterium halophilum]|uniref:Peptidase C11 n=1 Tax=Muiribacterium halophilum TaxID=2053465 RepID=A0A2N5ZMT8_MUIH1|nr:MAG: hypothetical protein C0601_00345 [Candidatus Muirbacterium halophilum]
MRKVSALILIITILAVSSFAASKDWTIMVFLNADNNLERFGIADFNEMETVGSTNDVNIIVQLDRASGYDTSNGDWTGTKRYYVEKDNTSAIASKVVMDMGEVDMGDYKEAINFFKWGATNYPAERYMFVYWNHGAGWVKSNTDEVVKGISYDDQSGNHIDSIGMKKAADAMAAAIGRKVDITAFDACLMGMVEIQAQLEDSVDVLIASEETEPGDGWPYTPVCSAFVSNPGASTAVLAREVVNAYMDSYAGSSSWWGPTACTQAASYLSKAGRVQEAVDALAEQIVKDQQFDALDVAMKNAQSYAYSFYKDLYHMAELIQDNTTSNSVKVRCNEVKDAVNASVIESKWQADKMKDSHGLAIYAPKSNEYKDYYVYTEFAKKTAWDEMLSAYYGRLDADKTIEAFANAVGTDKEEAIAKNIERLVAMGDDVMANKVREAAQENDAFSSLLTIVNQASMAR